MHPIRLLVVDDDPLMPSIVKAHYAALGIEHCDTARNGLDAMALVNGSRQPHDLIICDINMPEMDGVQLIAALADVGFTGSIAIISSQQQSVCRTALAIAETYGMKLAGLGRKPMNRNMLAGFLTDLQTDRDNLAIKSDSKIKPMTAKEISIAIEENRVIPYYQPITEMKTGRVIGAEALARIVTSDRSLISPFAFIETAERCGLLEPLTRSMFAALLDDTIKINKHSPNFNMAINWDPKLLKQKSLPDELQRICNQKQVSPTQITLEITETTAFEASPLILEVLVRLRLKGFGVAVDDYGTGYSNVDRLKRMPFSKLKIDQSFVRKAIDDSFSLVSVETAVRLASELDIPTVVEGVEEEAHWDLMMQCGATQAQGYLISRPLPFEQFQKWGTNCGWMFSPATKQQSRLSA